MNRTIGYYIKAYRKRRGLTQKQLADASQYYQSHISAVENNLVTSIPLRTLKRIANALEINYEYLAVFQGSLVGNVKESLLTKAIQHLEQDLTNIPKDV